MSRGVNWRNPIWNLFNGVEPHILVKATQFYYSDGSCGYRLKDYKITIHRADATVVVGDAVHIAAEDLPVEDAFDLVARGIELV
jgi:hypothetical protein